MFKLHRLENKANQTQLVALIRSRVPLKDWIPAFAGMTGGSINWAQG